MKIQETTTHLKIYIYSDSSGFHHLGLIFLFSLLQCKSDVCNYDAITCTAGSSLVLEQSPRVCFSERGSLYHIRRHLQLRSFKNSLLDSFQAAKGLLTIRRMQRINGILNTKYKNKVNQASIKIASLRTARNSNVPPKESVFYMHDMLYLVLVALIKYSTWQTSSKRWGLCECCDVELKKNISEWAGGGEKI